MDVKILRRCFFAGKIGSKQRYVHQKENYVIRISLLTISLVMLLSVPAFAKITILDLKNDLGKVWASGEIVIRYENFNWFEPAPGENDNNDYNYYFTRSRLGLGYEYKWIEIFVQAQHTHIWDLPDSANAPAPAGSLGSGAVYYAFRRNRYYHSTFIKQGYILIKNIINSDISLKGGRFEYLDALEVTYDNPKVMWLKKARLAERLIGPFGYSAFTRSFDGGELSIDRNLFNVTATVSHPTEGGFENDAHHHIDDITLATGTLTLKYDKIIPHTENRLFYFFYNDDRKILKADNTPRMSLINRGNIEMHTLGFHLLSTLGLGPGVGDVLLWGVWQWGDWGRLSHNAWAWDVEMGYQFTGIYASPWLRVGYFMSSGDSNPVDSEHETFFQILPTARKYARFPFYNLMNNEDFFIQLIARPIKKVSIRADGHFLYINEREDRWYAGPGANRDRGSIFGYSGRPSFGDSDLAQLIDLSLVFDISTHINLEAYYGHAWGDDVIENIYERDDEADFFMLELRLKF